ncbi:nicotinate phosphoribosyltransferase [Hanseniaspora osmophila]
MSSNQIKPVITSFLDTDLYKITMQAAVFTKFPEATVTYGYTNRSGADKKFTLDAIHWLQAQFQTLSLLKFTTEEIEYLRKTVSYLPEDYLEYIKTFQLNPQEQIQFTYSKVEGQNDLYDLQILVSGDWKETILYEIYILALVSESYFKFMDTDWDYDGQKEKAYQKAKKLLDNDISFSEFGSRRRRDCKTHDLVMQGIMQAVEEHQQENAQKQNDRKSAVAASSDSRKLFLGTSNVYYAKKYSVAPIGTVAHEWMMGIGSITGDYVNANKNAMKFWIDTFGPKNAGLALTDTFGTDSFLKAFHPPFSDYYIGVRQDSGDPLEYTKKIANHYLNVLKYPKFSKVVCYSDSLNVDRCIEYARACHAAGLNSTFGIGTNFTNDFQLKSDKATKSEPLNIVIKLLNVNGNHSIKISDNMGKNMGDPETVQRVKRELGYVERSWAGDNEAHRWAA